MTALDLTKPMRWTDGDRATLNVVNKLCAWLGRGPIGQYTWHRAAARAHGWNI